MKKQKWKVGDAFLIPLDDGSFSVGQILAVPKGAMGSVLCGFFLSRASEGQAVEVDVPRMISILFVTPDGLNGGQWKLLSQNFRVDLSGYTDLERLERSGYVGLKVIGAGIVEKFLSACFGLYPWNGFYKQDYLDGFLLPNVSRPDMAVFR